MKRAQDGARALEIAPELRARGALHLRRDQARGPRTEEGARLLVERFRFGEATREGAPPARARGRSPVVGVQGRQCRRRFEPQEGAPEIAAALQQLGRADADSHEDGRL